MTIHVSLDMESTSVQPNRRPWDIGIVVWNDEENADQAVRELGIIIDDVDLSKSVRRSLDVGRFYQRHPRYNGTFEGPVVPHEDDALTRPYKLWGERWAAKKLFPLLRDVTIWGLNPNFDTEMGEKMMRRHGFYWPAHYRIRDVGTLMIGFLVGQGQRKEVAKLDPYGEDFSETLSRMIDVEPPGERERHTALGDARWNKRIYDRVMVDNSELVALMTSTESGAPGVP